MKKIVAEAEEKQAHVMEPTAVIRDLKNRDRLIFFFPETAEVLIDGEPPL